MHGYISMLFMMKPFLWCFEWKKQKNRTFQLDCGQLRKPSMKPSFPFVLRHWFGVFVSSSAAGWSHSHDVNTMQKNIYSFSYSCFDHVLMLFL